MKRVPYAAIVVALTICALEPAIAQQTGTAAKASGDILPFKATEKTFPNGLKVMVVPTGFPNIVSLQIPVQGSVHRDNWRKFLDITLPMLLDPAFSETDFKRVKDAQMNALRQDLLAEDKVIGARKLGIGAEKVKVTPVEEVFAR